MLFNLFRNILAALIQRMRILINVIFYVINKLLKTKQNGVRYLCETKMKLINIFCVLLLLEALANTVAGLPPPYSRRVLMRKFIDGRIRQRTNVCTHEFLFFTCPS